MKYHTAAAQVLPAPSLGWRGKSGVILVLIAIVSKRREEDKMGETETRGKKTQEKQVVQYNCSQPAD